MMSEAVRTVRVVSTDPASQGPFVILNAADFDPARHVLFDESAPVEVAQAAPRRRGRPPKLKSEAHQDGNR